MNVRPSNLVELLEYRASRDSGSPAYTFLSSDGQPESSMTYSQLHREACAVAALLSQEGVQGSPVLVSCPGPRDFIRAFFGCLYAGGIAVPVAFSGAGGLGRLKSIADDAGAKVVLTNSAVRSRLGRRYAGDSPLNSMRWIDVEQSAAPPASGRPDAVFSGESAAVLQYTSGSTGSPRGVVISHANVLYNEEAIQRAFQVSGESIIMSWLPLHHDMGLFGGMLQPMYAGASGILMSPGAFLQQPLRWLAAISNFRVTVSGGPNFAYNLCVRRIAPEQKRALDLSCWRAAFVGAEPVRKETLEQFSSAFAECGFRMQSFYPCYGLAEATLMASGAELGRAPLALPLDSQRRERDSEPSEWRVSCGSVLPALKVAIVEPDTSAVCAEGQIGEICLSGPSVAQGYWNRPEQTAATFGLRIPGSEAAYLRTGDLGFLQDGELFIAGRLKEMMIYGGRNYYPDDIERTAGACHPAVRDHRCAAFSLNADRGEEVVLLQEAQQDCDAAEILQAIRSAVVTEHGLALHAVALVPIGAIPRTTSGKTQRLKSRADYLGGRFAVISEQVWPAGDEIEIPELAPFHLQGFEARRDAVESALKSTLARMLKLEESALPLDRPLVEIGLDSLGAAKLADWSRSFGDPISSESLLGDLTIADLSARLGGAPLRNGSLRPAARALQNAADLDLATDQYRLWLAECANAGAPELNLQATFRLRGPLVPATLDAAIHDIVQRHSALRASFQRSRPVQHISPTARLEIDYRNIDGAEDQGAEAAAQRIAAEQLAMPFDLGKAPLIRIVLGRLTQLDHVLIVTAHHLVCDAESLNIFVRELSALYSARVKGIEHSLPALPVQFADFIRWRQRLQKDDGRKLAYWRQRLVDAPFDLGLNDTTEKPVDSAEPSEADIELDPSLVEALNAVCRSAHVTPFMFMAAAFFVVLHRLSGRDDLVIGVPTLGRPHPDFEKLIGCFAYPLLLRINLSGDPTFAGLLELMRSAVREATANGDVPFATVGRALGVPRYLPDAMFSFSQFGEEPSTEGLQIEAAGMRMNTGGFRLVVMLAQQSNTVRGVFAGDRTFSDVRSVASLRSNFEQVLRAAVTDAMSRISVLGSPNSVQAAEPEKIMVAAAFTAEPLEHSLSFWMRELELPAVVEFAPLGQVFQQLLDPNSKFVRNDHGYGVILLRAEDTQSHDQLGEAIRTAREHNSRPMIVVIGPAAGDGAADLPTSVFRRSLMEIDGVYPIWPEDVLDLYPVGEFLDPRSNRTADIPYTPEFYAALGTVIARWIHAAREERYKAIAIDCDNTLWGGICGEDEPSKLVIDEGRRKLQEFLLRQHQNGMLLCLCSKNNARDVESVFAKRESMILRSEHIVASRINWESKAENLNSLAKELGIAPSSFILLDDDRFECAQMEAALPEVLTLCVPADSERIPSFLRHIWAFDRLNVTSVARNRTALYQEHALRKKHREEAPDLAGFLATLGLDVAVEPARPADADRIAELTLRTTQFNASGLRRSTLQLRSLFGFADWQCFSVRVQDRFGDYGLVGSVIGKAVSGVLVVDTFLLSCRALGRGVEHRMLRAVGEQASSSGFSSVEILFTATSRNGPVESFLSRTAEQLGGTAFGGSFVFTAGALAGLVYSLGEQELASSPAHARPDRGPELKTSDNARARSEFWQRVALEMNNVEAISQRLQAARNAQQRSRKPYAEPRTATERELAAILCEVLGVDRIGLNDDFVELGGTSLLAVQLVSRVYDTFGIEIPLGQFFGATVTLEELARVVEIAQISTAPDSDTASLLDEVAQLTDDEARRLLS